MLEGDPVAPINLALNLPKDNPGADDDDLIKM